MAQEKVIVRPGHTITRKLAAAVLASSIPTGAWLPVTATANEGEIKVVDAQNQVVEGYINQPGAAGDLVNVVIDGIVPVKCTGAVNRLDDLLTSSNGMFFAPAKTSGTTYNIPGRALTKCTAANEYVSVQIAPSKLRLK